MKKNVVLLTGIVFLFTLLVAVGCKQVSKPTDTVEEGNGTKLAFKPKVDIFLKSVEIDGSMHLEMYDSTGTGDHVIDGLFTEVYPGTKVKWKNAPDSKIIKINILAITKDTTFWGNKPEVEPDEEDPAAEYLTEDDIRGILKLDIPDNAESDTIKYEIHFTVKDHKDTTYVIDPYLKLPKPQIQ